jgi:hypothetical protein
MLFLSAVIGQKFAFETGRVLRVAVGPRKQPVSATKCRRHVPRRKKALAAVYQGSRGPIKDRQLIMGLILHVVAGGVDERPVLWPEQVSGLSQKQFEAARAGVLLRWWCVGPDPLG